MAEHTPFPRRKQGIQPALLSPFLALTPHFRVVEGANDVREARDVIRDAATAGVTAERLMPRERSL